MRRPREVRHSDINRIDRAIGFLRDARSLLASAGATRAIEKTNQAIKSCAGAKLHTSKLLARKEAI